MLNLQVTHAISSTRGAHPWVQKIFPFVGRENPIPKYVVANRIDENIGIDASMEMDSTIRAHL